MRRFVLLTPALLLFIGCGGDSPASPSVVAVNVPFSTTDLVAGNGASVVAGRSLSVAYTGWLYDASAPDNKGTMFDSATAANPFTFVIGLGSVIAGWDQGLLEMRVGGLRRIIIPPELGYGSSGAGAIPGNATLIFEIELLSMQ